MLQRQIERLGLNVSIPYLGITAGERYVVEQVEAHHPDDPFLFYHYTPSMLLHRYGERVERISFPEPSAACFEEDKGNYPTTTAKAAAVAACDFPFELLEKYASPYLEAEAPEVYHFVRHARFDDGDVAWLWDAVRNATGFVEGAGRLDDVRGYCPAHFEAACRWVKTNPKVWKAWFDGAHSQSHNTDDEDALTISHSTEGKQTIGQETRASRDYEPIEFVLLHPVRPKTPCLPPL